MIELLKECRLCPRDCGADRLAGERGCCGAGKELRVGRAALHAWEEPCLSGERGSGTVFFSYCNLQCVFCQNNSISREQAGKDITIGRLAEIFLKLQRQGAHNINLVTPTHYIPHIIEALDLAKGEGLALPVVYNTSGYEKAESLRLLEGYVDIYLPDFKYLSAGPARRYSHAPDYPGAAKSALAEMVRQAGPPVFDADGMMKRGVIVRHLILPGQYEEAKRILFYLHREYGDRIYISLMNQYTPFADSAAYPEISGRVPMEEYERLIDYAAGLGIRNGFVQEAGTADESFIPSFRGEGV